MNAGLAPGILAGRGTSIARRESRSQLHGASLLNLLVAAIVVLFAVSACTSASTSLPASPPATITSGLDGAEMIFIPGGEFTMGADDLHYDQMPLHTASGESFYMDKYEVTNARYKKFVDATGHAVPHSDQPFAVGYSWISGTFPEGKADYPVVLVSWYDADAYARWAGKRLPTEIEWEKAARGADGRLYPWGNDPDPSHNNTWENGPGHTLPVGSYPQGASYSGLMDLGGNVWEWTADWFERYPGNDWPSDKYGTKYKVARGSSWGNVMKYVRTSNRFWLEPETFNTLIGFRTAKNVD